MIVVNYHYCQGPGDGLLSRLHGVTPDVMERHAAAIVQDYRPVPVARVLDRVRSRAAPPADAEVGRGASSDGDDRPSILVTFDDGTRGVRDHALPILARHGIPAVAFCCSAPLAEGRVLDVQKVHLLQARLGPARLRAAFMAALDAEAPDVALEDPSRLGLGHLYRYDDEETRRFKLLVNARLPYDVLGRVLDRLFEAEFGDQAAVAAWLYMSRDDLLRAREAGLTIGLHTHSHRMLSRLDAAGQREEIGRCRDFFRDLLGEDVGILSYPYGIVGTFDAVTKTVLAETGIGAAFTLGRTEIGAGSGTDPHEIPRYDVNDVFGAGAVKTRDARTTGA